MKKRTFELYSEMNTTKEILENLKSKTKIYSKIMESLLILGNFNGNVEVEIYDIKNMDEKREIRLCCTDLDDNIFIFFAESFNKNDSLKITKESNSKISEYDISLSKKFDLSNENIDFTKTGRKFDFKYGRLICGSDFYSLFLKDNIGYQIICDYNYDISNDLIKKLNKLPNTPKLNDFINIFDGCLKEKDDIISYAAISSFQKFRRIDYCIIGDSKENQNKRYEYHI